MGRLGATVGSHHRYLYGPLPRVLDPSLGRFPAAGSAEPKSVPFALSGIAYDMGIELVRNVMLVQELREKRDIAVSRLLLEQIVVHQFRESDDVEGARELLKEIADEGGGTLKARAQRLLDKLS
jgi:FimV-like protein